MKIFYDCEFLENGRTIDLIAIGMAAENGDEFYAVNKDAPWRKIKKHKWLMANVVPHLPQGHGDWRNQMPRRWPIDFLSHDVMAKELIAEDVKHFVLSFRKPELWAWYGAYDHVALCQLYGSMIDLPHGMPQFTKELQQEIDWQPHVTIPEQNTGVHNELADAKHNLRIARRLGIAKFGGCTE